MARKKKNHISSLLDVEGRSQDSEECMAAVVSDFFASLFMSTNPSPQDNYLWLSSMVGRNKRIMFNDITDRVWKKLRGWKDSYFSFGRKETLIKAVVQAIPTYPMSIFKLPVSVCKDISAMAFKFWWDSREGKRKTSWISWENLCTPKGNGGMGFKNLSLFNQALLAKQAWRILSVPNSLAVQVLKVKYFKKVNFLEALLKSGCSHIWRSLSWGRELLSRGYRWTVRDGKSIRVFKDQWIPSPTTFKPLTRDSGQDIHVSDLIDSSQRGWNLEKLDLLLIPVNKAAILSIPDERNTQLNKGKAKDPGKLVTWVAGLLKLNIAATIRNNYVLVGLGATIRDGKRKIMVAGSNLLYGSFSVDIGHLLALRESLMLAKFYNFPVRFPEVSSAEVISSLYSHISSLRDVKFIVLDIQALLSEVGFCKCHFVPKLGNVLAQNLASIAFSSAREHLWPDLSLSTFSFPL
ncbi:hypothetical protein Dsin_005795 [Dipteronia sinensis]|uniref:RNase H type-1 domain-containing protein n=1 Tax=Dipteronia sinensis TaxID=43782 RepID=A0AAE0AXY9_9ROSI|nr:hypothetical protein Dsin_005795 [Dipteronia sinensis]